MEELTKIDFSFKSFFVPLTTKNAIFIIVIVGFLVYGNALFNGFVWDDKPFIILNPEVHVVDFTRLVTSNLFNDTQYYRPIPAVYFASLYSVFNTSAFPYHVCQLLLHITNTILLFKFLTRVFKKNIALLLSLIFLVHPMQVESVSYIAQTVSPLLFLFGIMALLVMSSNRKTNVLLQVNGLLLLSLLTKETGIIFVFLISIYNFLYRKTKWIKGMYISALIVFIYFLIRLNLGQFSFTKAMPIAPIFNTALSERAWTMPGILFYYIKTFFYPATLSIEQHWLVTAPGIYDFFLPLVIICIIGLLMVWLGEYSFKHRREVFSKYVLFSSWLLLGLAFHLQLFPLDMTVADRWFYLTMVGLLGVVGVGFEIVIKNVPSLNKVLIMVLVCFVFIIGIRTILRNIEWKDALTLYTHDRNVADNFALENALGWEYIQMHEYNKAVYHLQKSIKYWPAWDRNWYNLGVAYHLSGEFVLAKKAYDTALQHNSKYVEVIENLGYLLTFFSDAQEAKKFLSKAVITYPQRPKLWYCLAVANYKLGMNHKAVEDISRAYTLNPNDVEIKNAYYQMSNNVPFKSLDSHDENTSR